MVRRQRQEGSSAWVLLGAAAVAALQLASDASAAAVGGARAGAAGGAAGAGAAGRGLSPGFVMPLAIPAPVTGFWGARGQQQQQPSPRGLVGGQLHQQQRQQSSSAAWGIHQTALRASTLPPPAAAASSASASSGSRGKGKGKGQGSGGKQRQEEEEPQQHEATVEAFAAQLEPFGVTGISFCADGEEDELAVCCPETRRLMDCTVDMYASINGTRYCVALPIFSPVAICYHKGERMIPVENECELMDRLYDFLAPTLEQEDLFLIRSPVCLTLDGDLGDLGEEGEFSEEELAGWEAFESEADPWEDGEDPFEEEDEEDEEEKKAEEESAFKDPVAQEYERMMNPKYWDDAEAGDVEDAYGEDWEKVAAFEYDGVAYTMVKILEPVLVLAKEDPGFKGITKWVLPSEEEAEEVGPIIEGIIKVKLGLDDQDEDEDDEDEED